MEFVRTVVIARIVGTGATPTITSHGPLLRGAPVVPGWRDLGVVAA